MCTPSLLAPIRRGGSSLAQRQLGSSSLLLEGRLSLTGMGMGAAGRRRLAKDKRLQQQGDASHPAHSPSKLGLMISVSDPTSRLHLLLLLFVIVVVTVALSL